MTNDTLAPALVKHSRMRLLVGGKVFPAPDAAFCHYAKRMPHQHILCLQVTLAEGVYLDCTTTRTEDDAVSTLPLVVLWVSLGVNYWNNFCWAPGNSLDNTKVDDLGTPGPRLVMHRLLGLQGAASTARRLRSSYDNLSPLHVEWAKQWPHWKNMFCLGSIVDRIQLKLPSSIRML
ncbi:hypothetical protein AVEN_47341-1 [Araneus ventricosus]|uniref:Uncharacterized protein n=1 Tax=Araneus ventricosus TaxID=182803 RepID=A0A4Y2FC64_ARAVE|nr:hypothetical protein AVEN_47341-1 [Araneus ventricosus]